MDHVDRTILESLQENARTPNAEIARRLGMVPSAILERIRKLEERKIIQGYTVTLDAQKLDQALVAFVFVQTDEPLHDASAARALASIPEIQEIHDVAGEDCYLLKVRVADTAELHKLLRDRIARIDHVRSTRTTIVLETVKEVSTLPLPSAE